MCTLVFVCDHGSGVLYDLQRLTAELSILGVTYKGVNKSFSEIRHLFEEVKNPNVTIPTITIKVGMSTSQALGRLLSGSVVNLS